MNSLLLQMLYLHMNELKSSQNIFSNNLLILFVFSIELFRRHYSPKGRIVTTDTRVRQEQCVDTRNLQIILFPTSGQPWQLYHSSPVANNDTYPIRHRLQSIILFAQGGEQSFPNVFTVFDLFVSKSKHLSYN